MLLTNTIATLDQPTMPFPLKKSTQRYTKSLENELITNLVLHQFQADDQINFEALLSIPPKERIPALMAEYGNKRMYRLIFMLLREFVMAVPLPRSKKLSDTRVSVCACDLMLTSFEDQLSLEDLILFFERAKAGKYKPLKKMLTHQLIVEMFEMYLQERYEAYTKIKQAREAELKLLGPAARTSPEPTAIKNLFDDAGLDFSSLKKIS